MSITMLDGRQTGRVLALAALAALMGCEGQDRSPEGAARLFIQAVAAMEAPDAYRLLAPEVQKKLTQRARQATNQTGGRLQLLPHEMLVLGLAPPLFEMSEIEVLEVQGDQARVKISSSNRRAHEVMDLVRVKGRWRIVVNL